MVTPRRPGYPVNDGVTVPVDVVPAPVPDGAVVVVDVDGGAVVGGTSAGHGALHGRWGTGVTGPGPL